MDATEKQTGRVVSEQGLASAESASCQEGFASTQYPCVAEEELRYWEREKLRAEIKVIQRPHFRHPGTWIGVVTAACLIATSLTGWISSGFSVREAKLDAKQAQIDRDEARREFVEAERAIRVAEAQLEKSRQDLVSSQQRYARLREYSEREIERAEKINIFASRILAELASVRSGLSVSGKDAMPDGFASLAGQLDRILGIERPEMPEDMSFLPLFDYGGSDELDND